MDTKTCPVCGGEISANAKFCRHCGAAIEEAKAEPDVTVDLEPEPASAAPVPPAVPEPEPVAPAEPSATQLKPKTRKSGALAIIFGILFILFGMFLMFMANDGIEEGALFTLSGAFFLVAGIMGKGLSGGKRALRVILLIVAIIVSFGLIGITLAYDIHYQVFTYVRYYDNSFGTYVLAFLTTLVQLF
ncbi:MAG: zinc-ribbon domain-containing protein [bacterium]|nr:zinc-ribbon domain-containing protein [bacterium]